MYSLYYDDETWVDIIDFPGYQVSNTGKVRNIKDLRILSQQLNKNGYYTVSLSKDLQSYTCLVHRLVAIAFLPNPNGLPIVNHKDENTINPNLNNLEWCTYEYNVNYGTARERAKETRRKNKLLEQAKTAAKIIEDKKLKNKSKTSKVYKPGIDYSDFVFSRVIDKPYTPIKIKHKPSKGKKPYRNYNANPKVKSESFYKDRLLVKISRHTLGTVSYDIALKTFRNKISKKK